jgi:hypothetical protein
MLPIFHFLKTKIKNILEKLSSQVENIPPIEVSKNVGRG